MPRNASDESGSRVLVRRVAIAILVICVVSMILQAWRADAPNILIFEFVLAVTGVVAVFTVPWVVGQGRRRAGPGRLAVLAAVTIGASGLLGLLVVAGAFVDNTDRPIPWPISTIALMLPFSLLSAWITSSRRRVAIVSGTHLAVAAVVLDAARRCVDDDCYPLPLRYGVAGIAALWIVVSELAPTGTFAGDERPRVAAGGQQHVDDTPGNVPAS